MKRIKETVNVKIVMYTQRLRFSLDIMEDI